MGTTNGSGRMLTAQQHQPQPSARWETTALDQPRQPRLQAQPLSRDRRQQPGTTQHQEETTRLDWLVAAPPTRGMFGPQTASECTGGSVTTAGTRMQPMWSVSSLDSVEPPRCLTTPSLAM